MSQVRFRIGEMVLGEIRALQKDKYVFPQDIIGTARKNITDAKVTAMAQLLQSLDENQDLSDGIQIPENVKELFEQRVVHHSIRKYILDQYISQAFLLTLQENVHKKKRKST